MKGWISKQSLQTTRSHPAVTTYNGCIYVFGGGGTDFQSLNTIEIYDPDRDEWRYGGHIPVAKSGAVAFHIDELIYIAGGGKKIGGRFHFFNTLDVYNPPANIWLEGPHMIMPHDYPAGIVFKDRVYIFGGHDPEATISGPMKDPGFSFCEVFDPTTNEWHEIAPLPTSRFASAAIVFNKEIFVMGGAGSRKDGFKNFDIIESYDPDKDQWRKEEIKLPWRAAGLCAFTYKDTIFIAGGNSGTCIEKRFAYLDNRSGKWIELEPLPEGRIAMGWAIIKDMIYIIGGRNEDKEICSTVFAYDLS